MADFDKLNEMSWQPDGFERISFPITNLHTEIKHGLVEHKYPDRDGAHIEDVGMEPLKITCKALFYNNISRGPGETFPFGKMFPDHYNKFWKICQSRKSGILTHPFLNSITCNLSSMITDLSAERRDGVAVDLEWVQTIDAEIFDVQAVTVSESLLSDGVALLDEFNLAPVGIQKENKALSSTFSLTDAIDYVTSYVNAGELATKKVLGKIDAIIYHVDKLIDSIDRADSVTLSALKDKAQKVKSSVRETKQSLNHYLGTIRYYETVSPMTLGQICVVVKNGIVDLLRLNPNLAGKAIIPKNTIVKFLKA